MNQSIVVEEPAAGSGDNPNGTAQNKPPQDDIPEKYRGKSLQEVIAMHAEAEKRVGQFRDEIGQWRSLTDSLAQAATARTKESPTDKPTDTLPSEDDFFKSPIEATRKLIEAVINDRVSNLEQGVSQVAGNVEFEKFKNEFPDFDAKVRSDEFRAWASRSQFRMNDALAAAKGDMTAARRLMTDWNEIEALSGASRQETGATQQTNSGVEAARAASTDTGGRRSAPAGKPTYTRAEIVDMIVRDPNKYESLQAEIQAAIREGRVSGF